MAHGGHHSSGGHYHSHSRYRSGSGISSIIVIIIIIALIIINAIMKPDIRGRQPLEGDYKSYPEYVIDEKGYFRSPEELIAGLEYFHQRTNVQIVVMSSKGSWSDKKAVEKYYELFNDEAHVLIVCPTSWYHTSVYYAIGDLADKVIDDDVMDTLLDGVMKNVRSGKRWEKRLIRLTDTMLESK